MLPAVQIEDPSKVAERVGRSISDRMLEHHAHIDQRQTMFDGAYHLSGPVVSISIDRSKDNPALNELSFILDECAEADWDGYGALPISQSTYYKAVEFIEAIPNGLPRPSITPERDGEIALEWRGRMNKVLSVSLGANGRLTVLFLPDRLRTTMYWTRAELPETLVKLIELFQ